MFLRWGPLYWLYDRGGLGVDSVVRAGRESVLIKRKPIDPEVLEILAIAEALRLDWTLERAEQYWKDMSEGREQRELTERQSNTTPTD